MTAGPGGQGMEALTVPGTLESLGAVRAYVNEAARAAGLDKKASYRLALAIDEIATNIVTYGYEGTDVPPDLRVCALLEDSELTITVEDRGAYFDPRQTTPPDDVGLPLEQRRMGGWGVYLALHGVDRFDYERIGDYNRSIFVVRRSAGQPG